MILQKASVEVVLSSDDYFILDDNSMDR